MKLHVVFAPGGLTPAHVQGRTVFVIDILRATTTMCAALSHGAKAIIPVAVTDAFIAAVRDNAGWDLVHRAPPAPDVIAAGAHRRDDGLWVYRRVSAGALWDQIMLSTYDHAEPGVVFIDAMNRDNNLSYCETIEACNPCGEQPLPAYGCCDLGSVDLTRFVLDPFTFGARFDFDSLDRQHQHV